MSRPSLHSAECPTRTHPGNRCACERIRYRQVTLVTLGILAFQLTGGFLSGSMAILADSAHVATDVVASLISLYVAHRVLTHRDEERVRSFWRRASAVVLMLTLLWVGVEAVERLLGEPRPVEGDGMVIVGLVGGAGNLLQLRILRNERTGTAKAQRAHVNADLWASVVVAIGGALVWATGLAWIDSALSLAFTAYFLYVAVELFSGHHHHEH